MCAPSSLQVQEVQITSAPSSVDMRPRYTGICIHRICIASASQLHTSSPSKCSMDRQLVRDRKLALHAAEMSPIPLTEISGNVSRNGSQSQQGRHAKGQGQTPNKIKPDVVSSMLRTSTETGDVGQFSARPSRIPRPASSLPTRSRSGSLNPPAPSFRPNARGPIPRFDSRCLPRPVPSFSALSRHDTVRSNLTSYHTNPRTRCRGVPRMLHRYDKRPSPAATPGLYTHSSFGTVRGRPGYRPVSPAVSDAQSMPAYTRVPGYHRAASAATVGSSTASMFSREHPYACRDVNNSASSLGRFPSPAMPGAYPGVGRSPFPSRNATPVSASLHNSTRIPNGSVESFHAIQHSITSSTTPVYYDYTEAFAEDYCQGPGQDISISPLFSADHAIPEQEPARLARHAQIPSDMPEGSMFNQCEMPTQHRCKDSDQPKQSQQEEQSEQSKQSEQPKQGEQPKQSEHSKQNEQLKESEQSRQSGCDDNTIPKVEEEKTEAILIDDKYKAEVPVEQLSTASDQHPGEAKPRRASALSRRTWPASPSTSFFPNASRNSRDLTSLAACVYSPVLNSTSSNNVGLADASGKTEDSDSSLSTDEGVVDDWQLPSLDFTPLSFLHYSQGAAERSRSSGPVMRSNPPTIISPTPERPMSSQSRRRFSKILGLEENDYSLARSHQDVSGLYKSPNAGRLKRVLESSKTSYSARFSIPAFSPRNSMIAESTTDSGSNLGSTRHEQGSPCEKSTVESLLDKHIECLGLQPRPISEPSKHKDDGTQVSMVSTSRDESTIKIIFNRLPRPLQRAQTIGSPNVSITGGPGKRKPVSRSLFTHDCLGEPRLAAAQSSPRVPKLTFHGSSCRPSLGWKTLVSTPNTSSDDLIMSPRVITQPEPDRERKSSIEGTQQSPRALPGASGSSLWSGDSEVRYSWDDRVSPQQRIRRRALERQTSHRRKTRTRLKLKRNSQSQGRIHASESSSGHGSFHTAGVPSQDRISAHEPLEKQNITTVESQDTTGADHHSEHIPRNTSAQQAMKCDLPAISPDLPNRRSSVVAVAAQRVKRSVDMARKMSVKTIRSHRSHASKIESHNRTRVSAVAPHLKAPDLGPPLTPMSMSLNMDFAFPPAAVRAPAGLRATQSFFSDDSSAVQNHRGSLRKRFNLPSLRSVLPSSPRAHSTINVPGRQDQAALSRPHQSCHLQGLKKQDEKDEFDGTAGMSDFAYCRRKMLDRVKGWWRRRCVQRKLGLKRKKGEQSHMPSD
ncbi:hypothetical protein GJ744_010571 [Endocarpon pusillum]|uniref:Uncharacterized protein n=1 Tax=Endocarpon pusillum TaxID=364733 RepID=A0A8H7E981_9EURO|nr:hypothetical protein GJ744_010571 [Endocarpon pusillum]